MENNSLQPRPDTPAENKTGHQNFTSVIDLHDRFAHCTDLKCALGDGFLYATNPLYRNVRDEIKRRGFQIITELTEESRDFFITSVYQFDKVLFEKKLFSRQNVSALKKMASLYGHLNLQMNQMLLDEAHSLLFHESVHCVLVQSFGWTSLKIKDQPDPTYFLKQIVTAEATALSFEYLLCASYESLVERQLSYVNALGWQDPDSLASFHMLKKVVGKSAAALWIFRGYFASNYFYQAQQPPVGLFKAIYDKCLNEDEKIAKAIFLMEGAFAAGFFLHIGFRSGTSSVFFKMIGIEGDLKSAFGFDIYEALHSDQWPSKTFMNLFEMFSEDRQHSTDQQL
jgi:hypothetical protein